MSGRLTPEDLAEIRARCEAAADGPWVGGRRLADEPVFVYGNDGDVVAEAHDWVLGFTLEGQEQRGRAEETAAFIAAARTDVPRLLAEVEALRALAVELAWVVEEAGPCWDDLGYSRCYAHGGSDWPCPTASARARAREMGLLQEVGA